MSNSKAENERKCCKNCVYFHILEETTGKGHCRYGPPQPVLPTESPTPDDPRGMRWPMCWQHEWCGKYAKA